MNVEKFIKNEAKESLKGNWYKAIAAVCLLLIMPLLVYIIISMAYAMLGDSESVTEAFQTSSISAVFFCVFNLIAVASCLLMAPLYLGFTRFFARIAAEKKADVSDLFYYYDSKENYIDSFKFITNIIVRSVMAAIVCLLPAFAVYGTGDGEDDFTLGISVVLGFVGLIVWFLFVHRYAFAVMLYTHYGKSSKESMKTGAIIAKKGAKQLRKLSLSFTGWLLLNYLVLPFLYLFPYMTCSYFVSAKYLIEQYEREAAMAAQIPQSFSPVPQSMPVNAPAMAENDTVTDTVEVNTDVSVNDSTESVIESIPSENAEDNTSVFANANYQTPIFEEELLAEDEITEGAKPALSLAKEGAVESDPTV